MNPRVHWAARGVWAALLGVLLAGCGDSGDERPAAGPAPFDGIPWVVASGLDAPGAAEHAPTMTFLDGAVSGSTGCNRFHGPFTVSGDTLEIGGLATTLIGCPDSGAAVEREFLDTLERVARWRMDGDELVLSAEDGGELLRLAEPSPVGSWEATSLRTPDAVSSVLPGTSITATFAQDGTLTGSAGCNDYHARYTTDGGAIEIGRPGITRKACTSPDGVMEQEDAYVAALPRAASYTVEGERLTLLASDGTIVATFEAAR